MEVPRNLRTGIGGSRLVPQPYAVDLHVRAPGAAGRLRHAGIVVAGAPDPVQPVRQRRQPSPRRRVEPRRAIGIVKTGAHRPDGRAPARGPSNPTLSSAPVLSVTEERSVRERWVR